LSYLVQGDAISGFLPATRKGASGAEILPENGELDVPFLLDARLSWKIESIGLTFSIGRFIPKWGLSMPEKVTGLGAISYPLYVFGAKDSLGVFRNIGVEAQFEVVEVFHLGGGVWNGGLNTWLDDNDRKDMTVFFTLTPLPGFELRASSLFAFPNVKDGVSQEMVPIEKGVETHIVPILEARYRDFGLDLMVGGAVGVVFRHEDDMRDDYEAYGFMGHVGYLLLGDWFQLMGRFEWWEPNSEISRDDQMRFTVGPQFLIESIHAGLNLNYIQDMFASKRQMCEIYLDLDTCQDQELPKEAQNNAATIYIQFFLDL
jgi:hypothetical protein